MNLTTQIEDLIEHNASDFEISKLFKNYLIEYKKSLPKLFESSQGKDFLVTHTKTIDTILTQMYKVVLRRTFGNYLPMRGSIPIALIALGSYGREQLSIHSDIDLMIVYEPCEGYNTNTIIEKLLYLIWDTGMKLGHRVHEVEDIYRASQEDITIRTAFIESRLIYGSPFAWHASQRQFNKIRHDDPKGFILAKIEEAHTRRKKHPWSMQPNIKENVGGLRDSHLLFWIATTIYGNSNLKDLSGRLFSDEAYRDYRIALELLFRVRNALHLITDRQEDQLLFELMPAVAKMLGFPSERKMVAKILEAQWRINSFAQIFIKKIVRRYFSEPGMIASYRQARIAPGIYAIDGRLYATYSHKPKPINTLLELLIGMEDIKWRFDPSFLSQFTYASIKHPLPVKTYTLMRKLFERKQLYPYLSLFYDAGILHHLIPAFKKVLHLPQFDGYHHYPVDLHSIKCIKALESIDEPFVRELYENLLPKDKLLLKVAVLLHDTGKGRKQDHSEVGLKLIIAYAKRLKWPAEMQERAGLLVRHHILMSDVAQREDIHNEKTLYKFMSNIKTKENLTLLYILTYADINGVGPGTYNSFTSRLLRELYDASMAIVDQSDRITDATKRLKVERRIKKLEEFSTLPRILKKRILGVESNLFYFKHTPEEILSIAKYAKEVKEYDFRLSTESGLTIEIFRRIPLNLGYLLGKLSYLDVASMEIFTLFDEIKYFKIDFYHLPDHDSLEHIETIVDEAFDMEQQITLNKPDIRPEEITIDCEHSKTYAALNIYTANQRGLLAYIAKRLDEHDINIATAKIHSTKTRARDHFLIEKSAKLCDNTQNIIVLLTED
ncbi:MAG: HD domain-containing protein [Campylobacterota bacterium]|nr:HD domain-containing protein [Campylobacterota bacterium]